MKLVRVKMIKDDSRVSNPTSLVVHLTKVIRHLILFIQRNPKTNLQSNPRDSLLTMDRGRETSCEKESGASSGKDKQPSTREAHGANWNVMAVRGKVTDRCLWSACKAMTVGFLFILIGAGMATLGFYSDHLSRVPETRGNITVWVKNEAKDSHLGSLTYLGPVVMGIGGFTIVAACVMTFEARDTAAKIVPIWFKRTRVHVVSGGSGSTPSGRSSKASWERFPKQRSSDDAADNRTAVTEELVNFSKYLQNSVDTNKFPFQKPTTQNQQIIGIRKCPSEPSLVKSQRDSNGNNLPEAMTVFEASTPQPSQRATYGGGLKPISGSSKPQLLSVAPDTYRQAVSMDCPRSNRYEKDNEEDHVAVTIADTTLHPSDQGRMQKLTFQTSCATSSSGSMSVDIYLPHGAVTLKVHDDMKENKKSPLKPTDSDDSRYTKFSQRSEFQSFDNDEELLSAELDDSVFSNQDSAPFTPQIVLDTLDSINIGSTCYVIQPENHSILETNQDKTSIVQWAAPYSAFPHTENKSDSLEVQTPDRSPASPVSANFSFDCSEPNSAGFSVGSVISNPRLSQIGGQPSLSHTDTSLSFFNVSSLSMGSSQDISSPAAFCGSQKSFDFDQESASGNQKVDHFITSVKTLRGAEVPRKKTHSLSESTRKHISITLEPESSEKGHKNSPRKHSSLESAQIHSSKTRPHSSSSPKRHQLSLETSTKSEDQLMPPPSPRFLSPKPLSPTTSTALTFSPRKVRSESLPERRQAPSIKRFPLLRQGALDAMVEEGGSSHRLDRSLTQISPKDH
ncbi:hypothetical protein JTE90_018934 [Oedothorax gibbosus]|uniref:Transmembrane protein 200A n=1 Tax=Oedothorax gibbosus TaxID=931172 RepID=A0AAV6VVM9_9ARAC|nr:hypothetical protein JTE90_018934 [Oedothorax gibbosus]